MASDHYLRALRFPALTRVYDPLIRLTTRESLFKRRLLEQAAPGPGQRVLDLGCGTGTLALLAKDRQPAAEVVGLDADPEMLEQARSKAERAGVELRLDQGLSTELPYPDASFDLVLSTLFFHHLDPESKRRTAREIARVLGGGGELHVADWGRPSGRLMAVAFLAVRLFALPSIFAQAGLDDAQQTGQLRTVFGTLALYRAQRPARAGSPIAPGGAERR